MHLIPSPEEEIAQKRAELIRDAGLDFGSVLMEEMESTRFEYDPFVTDVILWIGMSMVVSAFVVVAAHLYNDYLRELVAPIVSLFI